MKNKSRFGILQFISISLFLSGCCAYLSTQALAQNPQPSVTYRGIWFRCLQEKWPGIQLDADANRAFIPQTGQNLAWDAGKNMWIDVKTGEVVKGACNIPRGATFKYCMQKQFPEIQLGADSDRAFDPESKRNFAWAKEKQAWIDVKTGECVCPKGCPPAKVKQVSQASKNEATILVNLIREDASPAFNTYGFNTGATHFFNSTFGVTGDFNANFKSEGDVDLKKISILGGLTFVPFEGVKRDDKVTISVHTLFGVSHFSSDNGTMHFTDNAFTMKLGGAVDVNVTPRFFIRPVQVDYAPTFFGQNTQHNFQFGAGAGFRF